MDERSVVRRAARLSGFVWLFGLCATVASAQLPLLINGSFESNYNGWAAVGNQSVVVNGAFGSTVSNGTRAVAFNTGQKAPNGVLSQTLVTTAGQTYTLAFDLGAFSFANQDTVSLQVTVQGAATLLSRVASVAANGKGTRYAAQTFSFVADRGSTTLTFADVSTSTTDVDLFLDNVRVTTGGAPPPPASTFTNGSFESGYTGWTASGNQSVVASGAFGSAVSDGTKAVVFNAGEKTPNGVLSQTFATTAGQTYTLTFDLGAFSLLNQNTVRVQVTVQGASSLLSRVASVAANGNGTRYVPQTFTFVADGASATLRFQDTSAASADVDLFLDHVLVTAAR